MSKVIGDLQVKVDKNLLAMECSKNDRNRRFDKVISCFMYLFIFYRYRTRSTENQRINKNIKQMSDDN